MSIILTRLLVGSWQPGTFIEGEVKRNMNIYHTQRQEGLAMFQGIINQDGGA